MGWQWGPTRYRPMMILQRTKTISTLGLGPACSRGTRRCFSYILVGVAIAILVFQRRVALQTTLRTEAPLPTLSIRGGAKQIDQGDAHRNLYEEALRILECGDDWYRVLWGREGAGKKSTVGMEEQEHEDQLLGMIRKMKGELHPDRLKDAPDYLVTAARKAFERLNMAQLWVAGETARPSAELATSELYKVIWPGGLIVRVDSSFENDRTAVLRQGALVHVIERKGRRAHIIKPIRGWVSLYREDGKVLMRPHVIPKIGDGRNRRNNEEHRRKVSAYLDDYYHTPRLRQMVLPMTDRGLETDRCGEE